MATTKRLSLAVGIASGLLLLAGCRATMGWAYLVDGPEFTEVTEIPKGKALLYLYRPPNVRGGARGESILGHPVHPLTSLDQLRAVGMKEGLVGYELEPGELTVWDIRDDLDDEGAWNSEDWTPPTAEFFESVRNRQAYDLRLSRLAFGSTVGDDYMDLMEYIRDAPIQAHFAKSGGYRPAVVDPGLYLFPIGPCPERIRPGTVHRCRWLLMEIEAGEELFIRHEFDEPVEVVPRDEALPELAECKLVTESR